VNDIVRKYRSDFARKYVKQGLEEGRVEGRVEERRSLVIELARARVPDLPLDDEAALRGVSDQEALSSLLRALVKVSSAAEAIAVVRSVQRP
jgi:hypothetical protein